MGGTRTLSPELRKIDALVAQNEGRHGKLLSILEQAQLLNEHKYLSEETLNRIALKTGVPLSRVYSVATFYSFFNLKPQGKHTITVCRGTACHTKGSQALLGDLGTILKCRKAIDDGETMLTTPDNQFTISTVACFGQCALAPVVAIDGVIYSNMTTAKLQKLLSKVSKGGKR